MFLGIDIGSSSSKAALIDEQKKLAAVSVINLGTGTGAYEDADKGCLSAGGNPSR